MGRKKRRYEQTPSPIHSRIPTGGDAFHLRAESRACGPGCEHRQGPPPESATDCEGEIIMSYHCTDTQAVCRGCGKHLNGSPYHKGGSAYNPDTGDRVPSNHYGGWVCSESCDRRASMELESSFPGAGRSEHLSCHAAAKLRDNWD